MPTPSISESKLDEIRQFMMDNVDDCVSAEALFAHTRAEFSAIFDEGGEDGRLNRAWLSDASSSVWSLSQEDVKAGEAAADLEEDDVETEDEEDEWNDDDDDEDDWEDDEDEDDGDEDEENEDEEKDKD